MDRMIRIRFHGRGGHGVKTAGRIVGTAAFLAGFQAQDSPVYGAERRGAAVTAFTRIGRDPILERGAILVPDLIVLADETLLEDSAGSVLAGHESASGLFLNTLNERPVVEKYHLSLPVFSLDLTGRTVNVLGRATALSAGLAAAAVRMTGLISEQDLLEAMRDEFTALGVPIAEVEKNLRIGREVFAALPSISFGNLPESIGESLVQVPYQSSQLGTPSVLAVGNAVRRHTGAWRVERPIVDRSVCTGCRLCLVACPDGTIAMDADGYPVIDYDHCKGCMICREVCPVEAITQERETKAW